VAEPADRVPVIELPPRIESTEFRERQERARRQAEARGLAGLLVWSRGAGSQDRFADVYYLAGFYPQYSFIPDEPGRWRARGHAALVLPVDRPSTLIVDVPAFRDDLAVADEVVVSSDVVAAAAVALVATIPNGKIGILGCEPLSWRWYAGLVEAVGERFVDADDLGPELHLRKSPAELALIRAAGALGGRSVDALMEAAVPGATEAEVAAAGIALMTAGGGMLYGLGISCGPYAHTYGQTLPAPYDPRYRLQPGDMARVDMYGSIDGYLFDFGRSRVVAADPTADQQALLDAARESVRAGIEEIRPGQTLGRVAERCDEVFRESDYSRRGLGLPPASPLWGHSLGLAFEPPWIVPASEVVIQPGMYLAVEQRVALPGVGGATYEDNVLVTEDGYEVVTTARLGYGGDAHTS
jgi:Xaa-Pro aminopeptidase